MKSRILCHKAVLAPGKPARLNFYTCGKRSARRMRFVLRCLTGGLRVEFRESIAARDTLLVPADTLIAGDEERYPSGSFLTLTAGADGATIQTAQERISGR